MSPHPLSVSSIGWLASESDEVLETLERNGVTGIEVAPTTIWPDPLAVSDDDVRQASDRWAQHGLKPVAMQALLFGRPDLEIFGSADARRRTADHLVAMATLGRRLNAPVLVFGSPKNRRTNGLPRGEVAALATSFFRAAGQAAFDNGVTLCIEPSPKDYGTDFITSTAEAWELVQGVDHPGFGLHLDAGALTFEGLGFRDQLVDLGAVARHFHVSEPYLAEFGTGGSDHRWIAEALQESGYSGWRSVEMAADANGGNSSRLERAIHAARGSYC